MGFLGFWQTPLGLWLLSSVFLSFGSWAYTKWTSGLERQRIIAEDIRRLDLEIQTRLRPIDGVNLQSKYRIGQPDYREDKEGMAAEPAAIFRAPPEELQLFPDYSQRGLLSLLVELKSRMSGEGSRCIERAILRTLQAQTRWLYRGPENANQLEEFRRDIRSISDIRWSAKSQLHRYLDRNGAKPASTDTKACWEGMSREISIRP